MMYYVYKITNNINGKFYIGKRQTDKQHVSLDSYMGSGIRIVAAIEKYGVEHFSKEILGTCTSPSLLNLLESLEITDDMVNDPNCYNLMSGGHGGSQGPEARKKISKSKLGDKNPMKHKVWTEFDKQVKREARAKCEKQRKTNYIKTLIAKSETYIVTYPCGYVDEINLLTPFCNEHKLCQRTMKAIAHKTHLSDRKNIPTIHKGYTISIKGKT